MDTFAAPTDQIVRALVTAGIEEVLAAPAFDGIDIHAVRDVIEGFGRLATDVIAPTDRIGDREGARLDPATGTVTVPDELVAAYHEYIAGGWTALAAPAELGGGGLPGCVGTAVHEMFGSANMSLSINPMLTQSAIELLERWADERQREVYVRRMVEGRWTGTMNLTEPEAGSDLGAVRATARPLADGRWSVSGTKIFITWGEHDLRENIVHLVLARAPEAPAGTKGISLFLVPKVLVDDEGGLLEHNHVRCIGIEHKLGIHASPTCVLQFDEAVGELVGPLHGGMAAMFSMMNPARLHVGVQGTSTGERSLQQALAYASERVQGRAPGAATPSSPIIDHPDVRRMLVDIATSVDGCRLLTYTTAVAGDLAQHALDEDAREAAQQRADLLTPLTKAWPTDQGVRMASLAVQVHGGMGFIEETGVAQRLRDSRIAPIYEGTNGIQAIDLVGRKVSRDGGRAIAALFAEIATTADAAEARPELDGVAGPLRDALATAREATVWVIDRFAAATADVLAGATAYLELVSLVTVGHLLARQALADLATGDRMATVSAARCRFFALEHLTRTPSLVAITAGAEMATAALGR